ncbi:MAG: hypothetical protein BGO01_19060 [Armatimonadetes bacterium 55-13]|nr:hypothetical protein [Armatimonadota bacterium]ODU53750.1 MAG: hypothetical protein ABT09_01210 [bacterium SCN 57-13]OJU64222.1 MAG: hypothetical protein BGO01_19060 [Armatimonadetes bacterium 55-13]
MSRDGNYLAMDLRSDRDGQEHTIVSRSPYFTALAISFSPLVMAHVCFDAKGDLHWMSYRSIEMRAPDPCPFEIEKDVFPTYAEEFLDRHQKQEIWTSPSGRQFRTLDGRIYEILSTEERELLDLRPYSFTEVPPPEWAKTWNEPRPAITEGP